MKPQKIIIFIYENTRTNFGTSLHELEVWFCFSVVYTLRGDPVAVAHLLSLHAVLVPL
jgi:hypothetical protein